MHRRLGNGNKYYNFDHSLSPWATNPLIDGRGKGFGHGACDAMWDGIPADDA